MVWAFGNNIRRRFGERERERERERDRQRERERACVGLCFFVWALFLPV